jgi:dihydropyrimidinase
MQLVLKNGTCVNPGGTFHADLGIENGKIAVIARGLDLPAERTIDVSGQLVLPGAVDAHVHFPWPSASLNSADDFGSGTTAAVCGGVTTVIEYVVPDESGRIIPTLDAHLAMAHQSAWADFGLHLILRKVTPETLDDMREAVDRGFTSFKVFLAYEGFQLSDGEILKALEAAAELGAVVCFHAEDGALVSHATQQLAAAGKTSIEHYPLAHPYAADVEATHRVLAYARHTGARVHIVHVNTKEGVRLIRKARRAGASVTGETCPQYLMFTEDVYKTGKPEAHYFVLAPVMRRDEDREVLWHAITSNDLQSIATDHCPYTSDQKLQGVGDFRSVPGGAGGVETSLRLLYTHGVRSGRFTLERLVELMSTGPARIFSLYPRKGLVAVGSDADLVIYDEEGEFHINSASLHSRTDHSLYEGMRVLGRPVMTVLRGQVVVEDGELAASTGTGQLIRRRRYAARDAQAPTTGAYSTGQKDLGPNDGLQVS